MESYLIDMFKKTADMVSGKQKEFWDWKVKNAKLLTYVKTSEIRKQYPEIDEYLKRNEIDVRKKECYRNAGKMCTEVPGVYYVEGEISYHGIPIEHAWNKIDDKYFDITKDILFPKNSDYAEYVKIIELDLDEYIKFVFKHGHWGGYIIEKFLKDKKINEHFFPRLFESSIVDRYYQKKLGIPVDYNEDLDKDRYNIVAKIYNVPIIKNPKSLKRFDTNVRAIVDKYGNLYIALRDGVFNHGYLADALILKGEINCPLYDYTLDKRRDREYGGIYSKQKEFLILNRYHDSNLFIQSDSTKWEGEFTEKIIEKFKRKHPYFKIDMKII